MDFLAGSLIGIGVLFAASLLLDAVGRRTTLPRVTLLLLLGVAAGPWLRWQFPGVVEDVFPGIAQVALVMVGFLLGGKMSGDALRGHGRLVFWLSIVVVLATAAVVGAGLAALGVSLGTALILAGISTSTAPAAVADVVRESRADGPFARTLLGVVAIDDAWGLIVFSVLFAAAQGLAGDGSGQVLAQAGRELGGALLLGLVLGVPTAYLSGRIRPGEPTLVEALGIVFLCSGIGLWLGVSTLLAALVIGIVVANAARHHSRTFSEIEHIEWPFMILFFVLSGASLRLELLPGLGVIGGAYVGLRVVGRIFGAWLGARWLGADSVTRRWMGPALLPQAGVALGMALIARQQHPEAGEFVLSLVIASTVVFEIAGPVLTRMALARAGELRAAP